MIIYLCFKFESNTLPGTDRWKVVILYADPLKMGWGGGGGEGRGE